jgi:hypothetical protein
LSLFASEHAGILRCAGGLRIAERTAPHSKNADLVVGPIGKVVLPSTPPMESQRSDGVVWRRHWAESGRFVIDIVGVAAIEVDDVTSIVTFDRLLDPEMEQHLLFDHVLPLVLARAGHVVLHGGVITSGDHGMVLVGPTGAGKSTLTAFAWQQGWTVGGDDGAVIHPTDPPSVEPTYATVRLTPAAADLVGIDPTGCSPVVGKLRVEASGSRAFRSAPVHLRSIAVVVPVPEGASAGFEPLGAIDAHARLFGATFHADYSRTARLPTVMSSLARIVERVVVGLLSVPRGLEGLREAERVLRSLVESTSHVQVASDDAHERP